MTIWENWQWVNQLLSSLPPAQREVLTYVVKGFKPAEVAILLGKTPASVRKNLQLAVERLRAREDLAGFRPANSLRKEGADE
jgi:DNA-directed RNA polymerase specialized sigma24 family protein